MKKWLLLASAFSPIAIISSLSFVTNTNTIDVSPKLDIFSKYTIDEIASWPRYDARDYNLVTPVKHQGNEGLCWAYSAVSTIETSILRQGVGNYTKNTLDISENWFDYATHNRTPQADKTGLNKEDVFSGSLGVGEFLSYGPYMSTQNIALLPQGNKQDHNRYNEKQIALVTDVKRVRDYSIEEMKKAIVEYGAISFSMELGEGGGSAIYYNNNPLPHNSRFGSHACSIIGWDDSISSERFQPVKAVRNGAWIVKNSWGERVFEKGFLYLSYDADISDAFVYKLTATEEYANTYFYDGTNNDGTIGTDKNEYAVIFPSNKSDEDNYEILKAFNIFVEGKAFTVSTKIYIHNQSIKTPVAGEPIHSFETKFNNPEYTTGVYSIKLPKNITLSKGQYYTIEVKLIKDDENELYVGTTSKSNNNNLTFIKFNDGSWWSDNHDVIKIKAFTSIAPKSSFENANNNVALNNKTHFVDETKENIDDFETQEDPIENSTNKDNETNNGEISSESKEEVVENDAFENSKHNDKNEDIKFDKERSNDNLEVAKEESNTNEFNNVSSENNKSNEIVSNTNSEDDTIDVPNASNNHNSEAKNNDQDVPINNEPITNLDEPSTTDLHEEHPSLESNDNVDNTQDNTSANSENTIENEFTDGGEVENNDQIDGVNEEKPIENSNLNNLPEVDNSNIEVESNNDENSSENIDYTNSDNDNLIKVSSNKNNDSEEGNNKNHPSHEISEDHKNQNENSTVNPKELEINNNIDENNGDSSEEKDIDEKESIDNSNNKVDPKNIEEINKENLDAGNNDNKHNESNVEVLKNESSNTESLFEQPKNATTEEETVPGASGEIYNNTNDENRESVSTIEQPNEANNKTNLETSVDDSDNKNNVENNNSKEKNNNTNQHILTPANNTNNTAQESQNTSPSSNKLLWSLLGLSSIIVATSAILIFIKKK